MDITGLKFIYNNATVIGVFCSAACFLLLDDVSWVNKVVIYCILLHSTGFCHNLLVLIQTLHMSVLTWEWSSHQDFQTFLHTKKLIRYLSLHSIKVQRIDHYSNSCPIGIKNFAWFYHPLFLPKFLKYPEKNRHKCY